MSKEHKAKVILARNKRKLKEREDTLKNTIKFQKRRLEKYEEAIVGGDPDAAKVFTSDDFDDAPPSIKEAIEEKEAIWKPNSDVQIAFLSATEKEVLFSGGRGPLAYGEKVLTPGGFKNIEDIKIGDWVVCPDNSLSRVIAIPFEGEDDCYEFEFVDGRKVVNGASHIWQVEISNRTLKYGSKREILKTTQTLYAHFKKNIEGKSGIKKDIRHILIPACAPVQVSKSRKPLPIDPYLLGLLLGDGYIKTREVKLTTIDQEIVNYCQNVWPHGVSYKTDDIWFIRPKPLADALKTLKLLGKGSSNKFIPNTYKYHSIENRYAILQGLMDTDGTCDKLGNISYCSVSKQLAEDVQWLVRSLGGKATITTKDPFYYDKDRNKVAGQLAYMVYIQIANKANLFRLTRKKARCSDVFNGGASEMKLRLKNIVPVGKKRCKCITIDDPKGLFITTDFIVTHNSGKSSALIVDALRYCTNPNFRGLVIRRTMPELRELIGRAKDIYFKAFPGTKWKEQDKLFIFPTGAMVEFGYCDNEDDLLRYQGQQYQWIGVDELTQFKTEAMVEKLLSSLRSTDPTLPNHFRATTNPSGPGVGWVKRRFIDLGESGKRITQKYSVEIKGESKEFTLTRKWFHSTIFDNKTLTDNNPEYVAQLASLEDNLKQQWLYGTWDSIDGLAFNDFAKNKSKIVIEPFAIPQSWEKIRGADWGYSSPAVCLWLAFDPEGTTYVYRELAVNNKKDPVKCDAEEFAKRVLEAEAKEYIRYGVLDGSAWAQRGESAPSAADTMIYQGCRWIPADRSPHSRVQQKLLVHSYLKLDSVTEQPKIKIFNTCKSLINCFNTLEVDKHNAEDINTDMDDHAYDALRYALASRPHTFHPTTPFKTTISTSYMEPINSVFGY